MNDETAIQLAYGVLGLFVLSALAVVVCHTPTASAAHDGHDQAWLRATLDACEPAWDAGTNPRIVAWDGRTLHGEVADIKDLFWRHWQLPYLATPGQPSQAELDGGIHLRRWRWEYECLHPKPPIESAQTDGPEPSPSRSTASSSGGSERSSTASSKSEPRWFAGYHFPKCRREADGKVRCYVDPDWPVLEFRDGRGFRCKGLTDDGRGVGCEPRPHYG